MTTTALLCSAEAGAGFILLLGALIFIAIFGTMFVLLKAAFAVLGGLLRGVLRAIGVLADDGEAGPPGGRRLANPVCQPQADFGTICGNDRCGHQNRPEAVYCARCGWKLR